MTRAILLFGLALLTGCASLGKPPVAMRELPTVPAASASDGAGLEKASCGETRTWTEEIERFHYAIGQQKTPDEKLISAGTSRLLVAWNAESGDLVVDVKNRPTYPYPLPVVLKYRELIRGGTHGWLAGLDEWEGPGSRQLTAARVAMRQTMRFISTPCEILRAAKTTGGAFDYHGLTMTPTFSAAGRLLQLDYVENDPTFGDTEIRVHYNDWRDNEPYEIVHVVNGAVLLVDRIVARSSEGPEPLPDDLPAVLLPDTAATGRMRTHYQVGWAGTGFPQDDAALAPNIEVWTAADGVHVAGGGFHNSMAVELDDKRLVLVEAPFSPEYTGEIRAKLAKAFPDHQIVAVVQSHWHHDHSGGLPAVFDLKVPIYAAGETGAGLIGRLPRGDAAQVEVVTAAVKLEGDKNTVEIFPIGNAHSDGMLGVYVPQSKLLFVADLLNPGLMPTRGLRGWMLRRVIGMTVPFVLIKAGTYAEALIPVLKSRRVEKIIGGHGPDVGAPRDVHLLVKYADREEYEARLEEGRETK